MDARGFLDRLVADGENGVLVEPGDANMLADALVRVLSDRSLAERLGAQGRITVEPWLATPEQYARQIRDLVEQVVAPGTIV